MSGAERDGARSVFLIYHVKQRDQSWGGGAVVARTIPMMLYLDRAVRGSTPCRLNLFPCSRSGSLTSSNPLRDASLAFEDGACI